VHKENIFHFKPYSLKELADFYGVCDKTFKKWLKPFLVQIGEKQGRFFTVSQVKIIVDKLGFPSFSKID